MTVFPRPAVALLAVVSVCAVLITPALDELPSTLPHTLIHFQSLPVTPVSVAMQVNLNFHMTTDGAAQRRGADDFLYLMCTLLC